MRAPLLLAFGLCLIACEGGDIAVFSAQAGTSGAAAAGTSGGAAEGGRADGGSGTSEGGFGGLTVGTSGADQGGDAGASNAGQGGSVDTPCHGNMECQPAFYCSKVACSDPQGVCLPRPFPGDDVKATVCGCDHVNYWNDTLRERYGVAASTPGECMAGARHCDHDKDCSAFGARCQHLLPPEAGCGSALGPGTCWVTPLDCSPGDGADYQMCPPQGGAEGGAGGAMPCLSQCQAVQSGRPFVQVSKASCP